MTLTGHLRVALVAAAGFVLAGIGFSGAILYAGVQALPQA
jgi:hypothetical protein